MDAYATTQELKKFIIVVSENIKQAIKMYVAFTLEIKH